MNRRNRHTRRDRTLPSPKNVRKQCQGSRAAPLFATGTSGLQGLATCLATTASAVARGANDHEAHAGYSRHDSDWRLRDNQPLRAAAARNGSLDRSNWLFRRGHVAWTLATHFEKAYVANPRGLGHGKITTRSARRFRLRECRVGHPNESGYTRGLLCY